MKTIDLRKLSIPDLQKKIPSLEENLFRLRCNKAISKLEDTSVIKKTKKEIAQLKTILHEKINRKNN